MTVTTYERIKTTIFLRLTTRGVWDATPRQVSGATALARLSLAHASGPICPEQFSFLREVSPGLN